MYDFEIFLNGSGRRGDGNFLKNFIINSHLCSPKNRFVITHFLLCFEENVFFPKLNTTYLYISFSICSQETPNPAVNLTFAESTRSNVLPKLGLEARNLV